ncbi:MAG: hypothetical protein R3D00_15600 [Bacteroidia bacterium]
MLRYYSRFTLIAGAMVFALFYFSCGSNDPSHEAHVSVQIDDYTYQYLPGTKAEIPVVVSVSGKKSWSGPVKMVVRQGKEILTEATENISVGSDTEKSVIIPIVLPDSLGTYEMVAEIIQPSGAPFLSRRLIEIVKKLRKAEI